MNAKIFDLVRIANSASKEQIADLFFEDFPYKTEDFKEIDSDNFPEIAELRKVSGLFDLSADLEALALLLTDKSEENGEIKKLKALFRDDVPFKPCNGMKFSELAERKFSAMFFPVVRRRAAERSESEPEPEPGWGLCVASGDGQLFFFNSIDCAWDKAWSGAGDSYKLAEKLAGKLVKEGTPKQICEAAKNWIVTGKVDENGKVTDIELGNKLKLITDRHFIIPQENHGEVSAQDEKKHKIYSADTFEQAWNLVSGEGVKPLRLAEFGQVDELHILVGESIGAQVASILLTRPKKVILWCSESKAKSKDPAQEIRKVTELLYNDSRDPKYKIDFADKEKDLSSQSVFDAENSLREYFKECAFGGKKILFNVTSGNRLMSYAVQSVARLYSDTVTLIYRDIDGNEEEDSSESRKYVFHILRYSSFPPAYGTISCEVDRDINLENLRNGRKKNAQDYYNELREKENGRNDKE